MTSHHGEEQRGVGMAFFAGMMNAMYFNKVKGTLKTLQDHHDKKDSSETDSTIFVNKLSKLYKTFFMWLDE